MRQLDRMRIGMALAGLLLCLTSSAALTLSGYRPSSVATADVDRLADLCNVNLMDDSSVQLFSNPSSAVPSAVLRRHQGDGFLLFCQAVSASKLDRDGFGKPVQTLVFYESNGQVDKLLYVTDSGLLYDSGNRHYFQPEETVRTFLKAHETTH